MAGVEVLAGVEGVGVCVCVCVCVLEGRIGEIPWGWELEPADLAWVNDTHLGWKGLEIYGEEVVQSEKARKNTQKERQIWEVHGQGLKW